MALPLMRCNATQAVGTRDLVIVTMTLETTAEIDIDGPSHLIFSDNSEVSKDNLACCKPRLGKNQACKFEFETNLIDISARR
jgi:hypothetical protein